MYKYTKNLILNIFLLIWNIIISFVNTRPLQNGESKNNANYLSKNLYFNKTPPTQKKCTLKEERKKKKRAANTDDSFDLLNMLI